MAGQLKLVFIGLLVVLLLVKVAAFAQEQATMPVGQAAVPAGVNMGTYMLAGGKDKIGEAQMLHMTATGETLAHVVGLSPEAVKQISDACQKASVCAPGYHKEQGYPPDYICVKD